MAVSTSAAAAVLNTYELLESILVHASTTDLTRGRGVSTSWKTVIDRSMKLKETLFLSPGTTTCTLMWISKNGAWSPTLQNVSEAVKSIKYSIVKLHPVIEHRASTWYKTSMDLKVDVKTLLSMESTPSKQMFITQPPTQKLTIVCSDVLNQELQVFRKGLSGKVIEAASGVTMFHLIHFVDTHLDKCKSHIAKLARKKGKNADTICSDKVAKWTFAGLGNIKMVVTGALPDISPWVDLATGNFTDRFIRTMSKFTGATADDKELIEKYNELIGRS